MATGILDLHDNTFGVNAGGTWVGLAEIVKRTGKSESDIKQYFAETDLDWLSDKLVDFMEDQIVEDIIGPAEVTVLSISEDDLEEQLDEDTYNQIVKKNLVCDVLIQAQHYMWNSLDNTDHFGRDINEAADKILKEKG